MKNAKILSLVSTLLISVAAFSQKGLLKRDIIPHIAELPCPTGKEATKDLYNTFNLKMDQILQIDIAALREQAEDRPSANTQVNEALMDADLYIDIVDDMSEIDELEESGKLSKKEADKRRTELAQKVQKRKRESANTGKQTKTPNKSSSGLYNQVPLVQAMQELAENQGKLETATKAAVAKLSKVGKDFEPQYAKIDAEIKKAIDALPIKDMGELGKTHSPVEEDNLRKSGKLKKFKVAQEELIAYQAACDQIKKDFRNEASSFQSWVAKNGKLIETAPKEHYLGLLDKQENLFSRLQDLGDMQRIVNEKMQEKLDEYSGKGSQRGMH